MITEKLVHFASASGCWNYQIQTLILPLRLHKKLRWSTKRFLLRPVASLHLCNWQPNWDPFASAHLVIGLPWWRRRCSRCLQSRKAEVRLLGWEGRLGKGMAAHSSILTWRISWTEDPGGLQSVGSQKSRTNTFTFQSLSITDSETKRINYILKSSDKSLPKINS